MMQVGVNDFKTEEAREASSKKTAYKSKLRSYASGKKRNVSYVLYRVNSSCLSRCWTSNPYNYISVITWYRCPIGNRNFFALHCRLDRSRIDCERTRQKGASVQSVVSGLRLGNNAVSLHALIRGDAVDGGEQKTTAVVARNSAGVDRCPATIRIVAVYDISENLDGVSPRGAI